jgi:putative membrane protein
MYRVIFIIIAVLAVALGLVIGTLNSEPVAFDLLWLQLRWPLGLLVLCIFVTGLLSGLLLAWVFGIMPLRLRLRKSGSKQAHRPDG